VYTGAVTLTDRQTDGQTARQKNRQKDTQTDGWTDIHVQRQTVEYTQGEKYTDR